MNLIHKKRKGFTLVEILISLAIISAIAAVAISSYINSTRTLSFLADFQELHSVFRAARSYAILNKKEPSISSSRYGVVVGHTASDYYVRLFADNDNSPFKYDAYAPNADVVYADKSFTFSKNDYSLTVSNGLILPVFVYYEGDSGKVTVINALNAVVDKKSVKNIEFSLTGKRDNIVKKVILYQVSGLTETK